MDTDRYRFNRGHTTKEGIKNVYFVCSTKQCPAKAYAYEAGQIEDQQKQNLIVDRICGFHAPFCTPSSSYILLRKIRSDIK